MTKNRYVCTKEGFNLTVGKVYTNILPHGNPLNICVHDDSGYPRYFDTRKFFKLLKPVISYTCGFWCCSCGDVTCFSESSPQAAYKVWETSHTYLESMEGYYD